MALPCCFERPAAEMSGVGQAKTPGSPVGYTSRRPGPQGIAAAAARCAPIRTGAEDEQRVRRSLEQRPAVAGIRATTGAGCLFAATSGREHEPRAHDAVRYF